MKKATPFYLFLFLLCTVSLYGQNSFPASGNVGIGTLTPGYSLDVVGTINATQLFINGAAMQGSPWNTSANNLSYTLGNVGIGTNTPGYTLDVAGTLNATNILLNGSAIEAPVWSLNGGNAFYSTGNVGIGTNTPGYALDVAGTLNATNILLNGSAIEAPVWSLNGSNAFYSTGNVGIGTNTPGYALDVAGTLNATNILLNGSALPTSPWTVSGNDVSYTTGNVGIGTANTQGYMLAVAGGVIAEGVKVELQGNWPDFVFGEEFNLMSLGEVEVFISKNGHLPNIPSEKSIRADGIDLGTMDARLLQKIEELTLYTIQQQKQIDSLKSINQRLSEQNKLIEALSERLRKIEKSPNKQ